MPALVKARTFEYITHILRSDGHTVEKAGTCTAHSPSHVYSIMAEAAAQLGGWITANHVTEIFEDEVEAPWIEGEVDEVPPMLPAPVEDTGKVDETVATVFGSDEYFGEYEDTYKGASLITYKETG